MQIGRAELFTDVEEITYENVIPVLRDAVRDYQPSIDRMNYLLNFEAGEQPLQRTKTYRADIDIQCNDNIANEITEFNLGYKWNSITLVQRNEEQNAAARAVC